MGATRADLTAVHLASKTAGLWVCSRVALMAGGSAAWTVAGKVDWTADMKAAVWVVTKVGLMVVSWAKPMVGRWVDLTAVSMVEQMAATKAGSSVDC